jgi:hypothetical protein
MRLWQATVLTIVIWAVAAPSVRAVDVSVTPPDDKSASSEIDTLIQQLGDPDFRKRESAVQKLREIGKSAIPALEKARDAATDPEVVSRADSVVRFLQRPPVPGRAPSSRSTYPRIRGNFNIRFSNENGNKRVEVIEPGRTIRIEQGVNGIQMSVTGMEDGKQVTREYNARTPEELQKQNPDAFELFQHWTGQAAGRGVRGLDERIQRGGRLLQRQPQRGAQLLPLIPPAPVVPGGDDFRELRNLLRRHQDFGDPGAELQQQREEILKLLDRLTDEQRELQRQQNDLELRLKHSERRIESDVPKK